MSVNQLYYEGGLNPAGHMSVVKFSYVFLPLTQKSLACICPSRSLFVLFKMEILKIKNKVSHLYYTETSGAKNFLIVSCESAILFMA